LHAEVGGCDAERLFSCNTELKGELQFCLLDHNKTSAEEVSNERSYTGKTFDKINDWKSVLFFMHTNVANKEINAVVLKPTITETIRLNRLCWFGHVQRMEENNSPKKSIMYEFGNNEAER